jgi:hypothetical protein
MVSVRVDNMLQVWVSLFVTILVTASLLVICSPDAHLRIVLLSSLYFMGHAAWLATRRLSHAMKRWVGPDR